ncbi:MAG: hypothetical protein ACTSU5_09460 [Promethearchaeota archaeon]
MVDVDKKITIYGIIVGGLAVLLVLASKATLDLLVDDPDLLGNQTPPVALHYAVSVATISIFSFTFYGVHRFLGGKEPGVPATRLDVYLWFLISRLGFILLLEVLHVRSYIDLPSHMVDPFTMAGDYSSPPLTASYLMVVRIQEEAVFAIHGTEFLPGYNIYLPSIIRLNNMVLEFACVFLAEKVGEQLYRASSSHQVLGIPSVPLGHEGRDSGKNLVLLYLVFPFPLLVAYVWMTVDLIVVLCILLAVYLTYKQDYSGVGAAVGLCFLAKYYLAIYLLPFAFTFLRKREWKELLKMLGTFVGLAGGVTLAYQLLTQKRSYLFKLLEYATVDEKGLQFPFIYNIWLVFHDLFPPTYLLLGLIGVCFVVLYSVRVKKVDISSFVILYSTFSLFIYAFAEWWVLIYGFFYPILLSTRDERVQKLSVKSFWLSAGYVLSFSSMCLVLLSLDPGLGSTVVLTMNYYMAWPYFLWLATGYASFVAAHAYLLRVGFFFSKLKIAQEGEVGRLMVGSDGIGVEHRWKTARTKKD